MKVIGNLEMMIGRFGAIPIRQAQVNGLTLFQVQPCQHHLANLAVRKRQLASRSLPNQFRLTQPAQASIQRSHIFCDDAPDRFSFENDAGDCRNCQDFQVIGW